MSQDQNRYTTRYYSKVKNDNTILVPANGSKETEERVSTSIYNKASGKGLAG